MLATKGTVKRDYTTALIRDFAGDCDVMLVSASKLAGYAEAALHGLPVADADLRAEIEPAFVEKGGRRTDRVVLACTHYPLLVPVLRRLLPDGIRLVDSATTCAEHLKQELQRLDMFNPQKGEGTLEIHLTDLSEEFETLARRFLSKPSGRIQRAVLA